MAAKGPRPLCPLALTGGVGPYWADSPIEKRVGREKLRKHPVAYLSLGLEWGLVPGLPCSGQTVCRGGNRGPERQKGAYSQGTGASAQVAGW